MKLKELNALIENEHLTKSKINEYENKKIIRKQEKDKNEIKGHLEKAERNLRFISDNLKLGYFDWCITGCYYAMYLNKKKISVLSLFILLITISIPSVIAPIWYGSSDGLVGHWAFEGDAKDLSGNGRIWSFRINILNQRIF